MATSETTIRLLLSVGLLHCSQNAIDKLSVIKIIEMKNAINSHKNVKKKHTQMRKETSEAIQRVKETPRNEHSARFVVVRYCGIFSSKIFVPTVRLIARNR